MAEGRNEGISMTGGAINTGALAVGRGARAHNVPADLTARGHGEVAQRLEELLRQLEAHAQQVPNVDDVREAARTVTDELAKERPNKTTVTGVLSGISESVQSVAGLARAANALLEAVQLAF